MHRRFVTLALAAGVTACAGTLRYTAPAPAAALDCAVSEAERLGYHRMSGDAAEGYIRFSQVVERPREPRLEPPGGSAAMAAADGAALANHAPSVENQLVLQYREGRLEVEVLEVEEEENDRVMEARTDAVTHAQIILSTCAN